MDSEVQSTMIAVFEGKAKLLCNLNIYGIVINIYQQFP